MTVLDRYLLRSLVVNYLIGLGVMLSLYVALDMFVNLDEFLESKPTFPTLLANLADFYIPNLFLYFSQLSGVIALFACAAAIARMRRSNELTAVLASGISLYRVARPVLLFALAATALLSINTEVLIPSVAHRLSRDHDEVDGDRAFEVMFLRDRDGAMLSAGKFDPDSGDMERMLVMRRDAKGSVMATLEADRAEWVPPGNGHISGHWALERARAVTRVAADPSALGPSERQVVTYPQVYESELDPQAIQLRQATGWMRFLSLAQLKVLEASGTVDPHAIVQTRHTRIVAPIVSLVLVLLGVPFFLDRSPANILSDAGRCMIACGLCYVVTFMASSLRLDVPTAVTAWLPIFVFGPAAIVLLDRVRT